MKASTRRLAALGAAAALLAAPAAHARGKLDLDIAAAGPVISRPQANPGPALPGWIPGDPRAARGEPVWVKRLSHAGYAGLGAAGLAGSVASGGVAPAIGFGLVALYQSFLEWRQLKNPAE